MATGINEAHVSLRIATKEDSTHILKLIQQLAEFERLTSFCVTTQESLEFTLFNAPPFQGPTVFLLEISSTESENPNLPPANPNTAGQNPDPNSDLSFDHVPAKLRLDPPVKDPQAGDFVSGNGRVVVGFVLFFQNYSTFLAKPGFYIEDFFVREPYRKRGFGTILLRAVAKQAVKLGFGRVEWCVLDWNKKAIKFYEGMGAQVLQDWRICRLTGKALEDCGI
uniref:TSA: Wollemia nobilis Ref_Wollemi_Transcript_11310_1071 transcribed RNA sequence n=1 Tax=Wollemia nobilis TaxID=56998 RepID=A0A0C9RM70_9CONI